MKLEDLRVGTLGTAAGLLIGLLLLAYVTA
jgi:hypothetical protein